MKWEVQIGGGEGLIDRTCDRSGQESLGEEIRHLCWIQLSYCFYFCFVKPLNVTFR